MKLFKTPWFYVGLMFILLTFTTTFNRILDYLDFLFANIFNYKDDLRSNLISLIPTLLIPLAFAFFVSRYLIKCIVNRRLY